MDFRNFCNVRTPRYNLRVFTLILLCLFAATNATILWNGTASNGNGIWKVLDIDGTGSITVVTDPTYGKDWQFYKPQGSHRTEGHGAKGFQAKEGDDIYIGWRFKLSLSSNTLTTNAIFQWKAFGSPMLQNYPIVIKTLDGRFALQQFNPSTLHYNFGNVLTNLFFTPVTTDTWVEVVLRIGISSDISKGFIELWWNGKQQKLLSGSTRFVCRTLDASYCDPKWGVYGGDSGNVTNHVNALIIATTYAEAAPK